MDSCKRMFNRVPTLYYIGGILLITLLLGYTLFSRLYHPEKNTFFLIGIAIIIFLALSRLAVALVNWLSNLLVQPYLLPRMNFSDGIPEEYRTMVVIPTMFNTVAGITELVEGLEVRFLANRDEHLQFALLTDFKDADTETLPEDELLLQAAKNKITELNRKYDRRDDDTFFLFHRPRKWNKKEKKWMGYERKRGKLSELNALILGYGMEHFSVVVGDPSVYMNVKFIITLDTDTQLPRDAAWKMAGTLAHPLNQAFYNPKKKRVTEGYTILQPRVSNSLPGNTSSLYARMHGNEPGTDPYTRATSDVYQDLFKEGSFIGKGIYNIAAFEETLKDKFPDNSILSHDLLEGCYSRSGLVTDVQLYEEYPNRYNTDMQRRHRWIRGDWQIGNWILPFVPGPGKKIYKNPLSLLSKWKIFDNIRRSLVPVAILLLLLYGWGISHAPSFWTTAVLLIIFLPSIINLLWTLCTRPSDVIFSQHLIYSVKAASNQFLQQAIELACLPFEVYSNLDAIFRTLWRMFISYKNLLQWNPYHSTINSHRTLADIYNSMWFGPALSIIVFSYLTIYAPLTLVFAMPLLILWTIAPFITWFISRPVTPKTETLSAEQTNYLRMLGRKIWFFFEKFVTQQENWLPPDKYQEDPVERIAHRTSPTNIGLCLLSYLTANDFGYISIGETINRAGNTLNTMQRMERYRGHFYNWYDTETLAPLHPRYISTVDSGNLAGHLVTMQQGLLELADKKIITENIFEGLADATRILIEKTPEKELLIGFLKELESTYADNIGNVKTANEYLEKLDASFTKILLELDLEPDAEDDEWAQKILAQVESIRQEVGELVPWLLLPATPQKFQDIVPDLPAIPTIKQLAKIEKHLFNKILGSYSDDNTPDENEWLNQFRAGITQAGLKGKQMVLTLEQLSQKCREFSNIEYDFLYDRNQH
ncbi:MAG: cyclic beta 1-2 glucan synthetase, partial [Gloeobacteraceae cyanobacterium ES-bin-316]|nr:cyclic beta 1-2 glucan synthetase [Ferruginibacter sp.]